MSLSEFAYQCLMTGPSEPQLFPNEEVYVRLQNQEITMEDHDNKKKVKKGNILLTTHRVIYYINEGSTILKSHSYDRQTPTAVFRQVPHLKMESASKYMFLWISVIYSFLIEYFYLLCSIFYDSIYFVPCPTLR